jgi:hypothetical protein
MFMNIPKLPALAVASLEAGKTAAHENIMVLNTFKNLELTSSFIK